MTGVALALLSLALGCSHDDHRASDSGPELDTSDSDTCDELDLGLPEHDELVPCPGACLGECWAEATAEISCADDIVYCDGECTE